MSKRLPSAPESSSAVPSCRTAAHCNLTGRRVVDEALLRDTPPDSSLRPTVGPGLLRGTSPGNGQPRHSTNIVPSSSDDLSPPGRAGGRGDYVCTVARPACALPRVRPARDQRPSSSPVRVSGTRNNKDGNSPTPPFPIMLPSLTTTSALAPP